MSPFETAYADETYFWMLEQFDRMLIESAELLKSYPEGGVWDEKRRRHKKLGMAFEAFKEAGPPYLAWVKSKSDWMFEEVHARMTEDVEMIIEQWSSWCREAMNKTRGDTNLPRLNSVNTLHSCCLYFSSFYWWVKL